MKCKECGQSREAGVHGIYCRMYGIMVHGDHGGCRYFSGKEHGDDEQVSRKEDPDGGRGF